MSKQYIVVESKKFRLHGLRFRIVDSSEYRSSYMNNSIYLSKKCKLSNKENISFLRNVLELANTIDIKINYNTSKWQTVNLFIQKEKNIKPVKKKVENSENKQKFDELSLCISEQDNLLIQSFKQSLQPLRRSLKHKNTYNYQYDPVTGKLVASKSSISKRTDQSVSTIFSKYAELPYSNKSFQIQFKSYGVVQDSIKHSFLAFHQVDLNSLGVLYHTVDKEYFNGSYIFYLKNDIPVNYRIYKMNDLQLRRMSAILNNDSEYGFIICDNYWQLRNILSTYEEYKCVVKDLRKRTVEIMSLTEVRNLLLPFSYKCMYEFFFCKSLEEANDLQETLTEEFDNPNSEYCIYTDGSYSGGINYGSAFVVVRNGELYDQFSRYGFCNKTYEAQGSSIAEFTAIIEAMQYIKVNKLRDVTIFSDEVHAVVRLNDFSTNKNSGLLIEFANKMNKLREQLKNNGCKVKFKYVKGHSTNQWNQLVDNLAVRIRRMYQGEYF